MILRIFFMISQSSPLTMMIFGLIALLSTLSNNAPMSATDAVSDRQFSGPFKVGRVLVDPVARTISCNDDFYPCEPKVFDFLLYFCSQNNEIVTRDMLLRDIWQGRVVSDNAINRKIYQLRKLLNELDDQTEYLETIPKFGYRLTQDIVPVDTKGRPTSNNKNYDKLLWPFVGLCIVLIAFLLTTLNIGLFNQPPETKLKQLTALPGLESYASLSADGERLIFSFSDSPNTTQLKVKNLKQQMLKTLTEGDFHDVAATWHPKGKKIAFVRLKPDADKPCAIYQLDISKPQSEAEKLFACSDAGIPTLSWSNKDQQLFFAERSAKNKPYIIYSLDIKNRVKKQLTQPPLEDNYSGDFFIRRNASGDKQVVLRYKGSNLVEVTTYRSQSFETLSRFMLVAHLTDIAWSSNENWFYYRNKQHIYRVDEQGQNQQQIFHLGKSFHGLSYADKNEMLLFSETEVDTDIWLLMQNKTRSFIGSTKRDSRPRFANQSNKIAFISDQSGSMQFWLKQEQGELTPLSNFEFDLGFPWFSWSPKDKQLLFEHQESIYSLAIDSGQLTQHLQPKDKAYIASWSNNEKSLFYSSNKSGSWQLYQLTLSDKSHKQLTFDGGYSAIENPTDGRLYFSKYQQQGLWRLNQDGSETLIIGEFSILNWLNWQIRHNQIIYAEPYKRIMSYDLQTAKRKILMELTDGAMHDYSMSAIDGSIIFTKYMSRNGDVLALELD